MSEIVAAVVFATTSFMAGKDAVVHQTGVTPAWAMSDWARLVRELARRMRGEGTILVNPPGSHIISERRAATARFVEDLAKHGWKTTHAGAEYGWFTCLKKDHPNVTFGVLPWQSAERSESLFSLTDTPSDIAHRLAAYHQATGSRWCGSGGTSGAAAIRKTERAGAPMWHWSGAPKEPAVGCSFEMSRTRAPQIGERAMQWVHHYDVRGMYLAAAGSAELGFGVPEPQGPIPFDRKRPGYWRVLARSLPVDPMRVLYRTPDDTGSVWLTTARLDYLIRSWNVCPEVLDATVSRDQARVLRNWASAMNTALSIAPAYVVPAVKDTYARTVGMMRRPTGRIYRPDWRDTIVDTAAVNLLRKLDTFSLFPMRIRTDSVWVASTTKTPKVTDDGKIGQLRYEDTMPMSQYLATIGAPR